MKLRLVLTALAMTAGSTQASLMIVNNIPGTFVDISTTGTQVGQGDDAYFSWTSAVGNPAFPAGTIGACTNGFMVAGLTSAGSPFTNNAIGATGVPAGMSTGAAAILCPLWDDLQNTTNPTSFIYRQEIGGVLYVQWNNYGHYSSVAGNEVTFQVQIFNNAPGGVYAQFLYPDATFGGTYGADGGASATIGYVGPSNGTDPTYNNVQYSFNTTAIQDGSVLTLVPAPSSFALIGIGGLLAGRRRR
jgi:hypothetical protein